MCQNFEREALGSKGGKGHKFYNPSCRIDINVNNLTIKKEKIDHYGYKKQKKSKKIVKCLINRHIKR